MKEPNTTNYTTTGKREARFDNQNEELRRLEELIKDLEKIFGWTMEEVKKIKLEGMGRLEKSLREKVLQLGGKILEVSMLLGYGTGYNKSRQPCAGCGSKGKFINYRWKTITTLMNQVELKRAYYYCKECRKGWVPLDRELGIEGTIFSSGVQEAICRTDAEIPFERGRELLEELSAVRVDGEEGRNLSEELGQELEEQAQDELKKVWEPGHLLPREVTKLPERLYLSYDGTTIPTTEGWKEVKVGALFTTRIPHPGEDPVRELTRYLGTLENAEAFGKRLYVEATKLGLTEEGEVVVLGDGASWIWNQADQILPSRKRVEIIDFYHAAEKIWT